MTQPSKSLSWLWTALLSTVIVLLAGCGTNHAGPDGVPAYWVEQIEAFLAGDVGDLERRILEDFYISDAEWQEALDAYAACKNEHGMETIYHAGMRFFTPAPGTLMYELDARDDTESLEASAAASVEIMLYCEQNASDIGMIGFFYHSMRGNPEGLDFVDASNECLDRYNIPDFRGLTDEQISAVVAEPDFKPSSAQAWLCLVNPFGTDSYTLEDAEETLRNWGEAEWHTNYYE